MARLIELHGQDFCAFEEFRLPLAKQGLVFINGVNMDSDAAVSNGACKTGVFKALGWGLYGKAIDNEAGDQVIRKGTKCARVEIPIEDGDDTYLVIRERRKQSPKLFVKKNGEPMKGSKVDLQKTIDRLIGTDWEGFKNTGMYGQNDRDRFVYPTTKDADRKKILHRILRTSIFELCFEEAKKQRRALVREREAFESTISTLTTRIDDHDMEAIADRIREFDAESIELARELAEEAKEIGARAKSAHGAIDTAPLEARRGVLVDDLDRLALSIGAAKDRRKRARTAYSEANGSHGRLQGEASGVASTLELLDGDQCPTCTGQLSKGRGKAHRSAQKARAEQLVADIAEAHKARQKGARGEEAADSDLEAFEDHREELSGSLATAQAQLDSANTAKERAAELVAQARAKADEARATKRRGNPHAATLEATKAKVKGLKRDRKAAKGELRATDPKLAALEFWVRGYGPTGIPSFALDSVMPILTDRANHYLETLSDGDMSINFSTQRELKSGDEYRDEIGITWSIEGIEDYPPSGGQWKKMEIATNFAMMDLVSQREGSHVNILCLDECLDGLDSEGRQRVVQLLHKLRNDRESIFVISHDPGFSEIFEKTVTVTKQDGVSRLRLAA